MSSVSLQRTYRIPKEIRVEPQKFAAELIHRLEAVQRTREAEEKLEERLKRVRMVSWPQSGRPRRRGFQVILLQLQALRGPLQVFPEPPSPYLTAHWLLTCFSLS